MNNLIDVSGLWVKVLSWLPLCVAACQYPALPRVAESLDGGSIPVDATALPDAFVATDASLSSPTGFVPLHVRPSSLLLGAPDLVPQGDHLTIDTDALTIGGETSTYFIHQDSYAILYTGLFAVQKAVTIQGTSPLVIVASGRVNIIGSIDLAGHGFLGGPGATTTGAGKQGLSFFTGAGGGVGRDSSGGGGGSYGSLGGMGGSPAPSIIPGGDPGPTYGTSPSDPLVGGSRGGDGGFAGGGGGGGGGGALQISSGVSIAVYGHISAGGGGAGGGSSGLGGGGGGGAGGEILLEAPTLTFQTFHSLVALGGGGGAGGSGDAAGTPGGNGGDVSNFSGGGGGTAGNPMGAQGGNGADFLSELIDAQPGSSMSAHAGGGGGGAGRIWLRYRATSSAPAIDAGMPAAVLDSSLP